MAHVVFTVVGVTTLSGLVITAPAYAWGPHMEITRAAQAVLPDAARLKANLGDEWVRLAKDYCWMGDWREAVRPDHYADDYLLFPAAPEHFSHMPPEVRRTYQPFFRRALQAIRTEDPRNAARWVGSLLHFVQDSGSPPHAASVGGETHAKMERWVDESKIDIVGYRPRLLGKSDDEAMRGLVERLDQLHEFARVRGEKLKPLVENCKERVNQPLELECALETARVTADLLHTLYTLGATKSANAGVLRGKLDFQTPSGYAAVPAKVMLARTNYSTTTIDGNFSFGNLPAGKYDVWLLATGFQAERLSDIEVKAGRETIIDRKLQADSVAGNLVRNPAFAVQWIRPTQPDAWSPDSVRRGRWAAALIRVPVDRQCRLRVEFKPEQSAPIAIRWRSDPSKPEGAETKIERRRVDALDCVTAEVAPNLTLKPFESGFLYLEILIETDRPLPEVCKHVAVTIMDK